MSILIQIIGGLGNQMFQYALARSLDQVREEEVLIDITAFERDYDLWPYQLDQLQIDEGLVADTSVIECLRPDGLIDRALLKTQNRIYRTFSQERGLEHRWLPGGRHRVRESTTGQFNYHEGVFNIPDDSYIVGYWQAAPYFQDAQPVLQEELQPRHQFDGKNEEAINTMDAEDSASIHIRRGDYLNNPAVSQVCTMEYYQRAVQHIKETVGSDVTFYVFSDDIDWVKENLDIDADLRFVDWNRGEDSHLDMFLMSHCDDNIIANSTFSWWGAWLNSNPDKVVVAPDPWHLEKEAPDLLPTDWTRINGR